MVQTTRRWTIDDIGPKNLRISEGQVEEVSGNKVLVRTEAVSLNFRDRLVLESGMGLPLKFPFVPASDMAGVVEAVGPDVTRFKPGDRVISNFSPEWIDGAGLGNARTPPYRTRGGYYPGVLSEYTVFPEGWFSLAPSTLDPAEASTLPCAGLTAWFALIELGKLRAGDKVVVQGTGGVALFGLQIAKAHGAEVFITSGSAEKLDRALALGADHTINRNEGDWVERLYELTDDYGADHVLEIVGGPHLGQALKAVAVKGRISVIGVFEGFEVSGPAGPLLAEGAGRPGHRGRPSPGAGGFRARHRPDPAEAGHRQALCLRGAAAGARPSQPRAFRQGRGRVLSQPAPLPPDHRGGSGKRHSAAAAASPSLLFADKQTRFLSGPNKGRACCFWIGFSLKHSETGESRSVILGPLVAIQRSQKAPQIRALLAKAIKPEREAIERSQ